MKTKFAILILDLLLLVSPSRCVALYGIADVSNAEAKEMGVTIRMDKNGDAGIRVSMEFKTTGKLRKFTRVEVQIGEGKDRIMSAPLRESHPSAESVAVHFSADLAYLSKSTLWVYVADQPEGGTVYRFKVKDFI